MGKRELVLVALFVVIGVVIYQVTAPPLAPGQEGFSLGRVIQNLHRGIQGRRARASVESARTEAIGPEITELRLTVNAGEVTVIGEDRADVALNLKVSSNGSDDADARRLAGLTTLKVEKAAAGLIVGLDYPRDGVQQATLAVRVPKRLAVRVESKTGRLEISSVAAAVVKGNRGDTTITSIAGEADVMQRGGDLRVARAASLRLNLVNSNAEVTDITGVASIDATGAKIQLSAIVGPLDLKSRNTDVRLRDAPALKTPLRLDMQAGELDVDGLRTEARIDGRNTDIRVALEKAAPVTIYNTGENIAITLPSGGLTVDAVATDGAITSEDSAIKISGDDREHRAAGAVHGGGPALTLRATRGRIELRKNGAAEK